LWFGRTREPRKLANRPGDAAERTEVERAARLLLNHDASEFSIDAVDEAASKPLDCIAWRKGP
jgi:hypothetical protein